MTNAVTWFEIGTDQPEAAERFYGDLFGWTFRTEGDAAYRIIDTGAGPIGGGLRDSGGTHPGYAIFNVQVADVADACRRAEAAGGRVLVPLMRAANGLTFAHLLDPSGNQFGIFAPPAGN
ncbi:VOC family protein [Micromonospora echinofusca]|uniref:VOC family protein n=1 Tax=Micromonospora echinofusca TaxID=47858 RepID=A0ABS3VLK5_MICEH|nr:VOC family protein [Micromonospora echinofusca]MBO4205400.1 VOC family protein [Micromonospora echinofusca]